MEIHISKRMKRIALYTLLFMVIMHGSRYFSLSFSHDALAFTAASDFVWKISLGRYMQPLYWKLRGQIAAPFIVGMLSYVWLTLSIYFVSDILKIKEEVMQFLLAGVMTGSIAVVASNMGYIHESDTFMLALFLCVLAAWVCLKNFRLYWLFAPFLLAASAALYQAYIQVYVVLTMIWAIKQILVHEERCCLQKTLICCVRSAILLLLGMVAYFFVWKLVLNKMGIQPESGYNGMTEIGNYNDIGINELIIGTWTYPFEYLWNIKGRNYWLALLPRLAIGAYAFAATMYVLIKKQCSREVFVVVCGILFLLPAGMNCVYIISKGLVHDLIIYAYCFADVYAIVVTEYAFSLLFAEKHSVKTGWIKRGIVYAFILMFGVVFFDKALYANQGYLKKELEYDSTHSVMTRVIDRLEQLDGYEVNKTPVALCGQLIYSPLSLDNKVFSGVQEIGGFWGNYSTTFDDTYWWYFRDIMGYPIVKYHDQAEIQNLSEVKEMAVFPGKGSVAMINGIAVIKLSEQ